MKRNIIATGVMIVSLFSISFTDFSQGSDIADQFEDGKKIVEEGKVMIEKGALMKNCDLKNKKMVEQLGKSLIKEGLKMMENGVMLWTDRGEEIVTENAFTMMQSGRMLMKMGKMKSEYTTEDKNKIVKQGELMMGKGKLMVKEGELMQ